MRKSLSIAVLVFLILLLVSAAWLLYTPSGARFFFSTVSRIAPLELEAGTVSGRLAKGLDLTRVRLKLKNVPLSMDLGRVQWSWRPARLLRGAIAFDRFHAEDVHIVDNRPGSKGWSLALPAAPRFLAGQQAWIRDFEMERVRYDRLGREAFSVDRAAARLFWHHGALSVNDLVFDNDILSARGTVEAGFFSPLLKADMTVDVGPPRDRAGRLSFGINLGPAQAPEHLSGPVLIVFTTAGKSRLVMNSRVGLEEKLVRVKALTFTLSDLAGSLSGTGSIDMSVDEPYMRLDARVSDMRGKKGAAAALVVTGTIRAQGTPGDYSGSFQAVGRTAGEKSKAWQTAQAGGVFRGNTGRAEVSIGEGRWLGGSVTGAIRTVWSPAFGLSSSLRGRGLNPAEVSPDWKGTVNIDADLDLEEAKGGLGGSIRASFPRSTLRGRSLLGDLKASFRGDSFHLERLVLHGKGFDIEASGSLQDRLAFNVAAADLSGLLPSASGSLVAGGWLQRRSGQWAGSVSGKGSAISADRARVEKAEFSAKAAGAGGRIIDANLRARGVSYRAFRADRLAASIKGSKSSHTIEGEFGSGAHSVRLSLQGGLEGEQWEGRLVRLSGGGPSGEWRLDAPAGLLASWSRVRFGAIKLSGSAGESLGARGDLFLKPLRGSLSAEWDGFNLARLNPLLSGGSLAGSTSGNCSMRWSEEAGARVVEAQASVAGLYKERRLSIPLKGRARARWDGRGLAAGWNAALDGQGEASGTVTASGPPEMRLPDRATVNAAWQALDIGAFGAWLPAGLTLKGALSGRVDGSILPGRTVSLTGRADIARGYAGWKGTNGAATTAIQTGSASFEWSGKALQGSVSMALAGYGKLGGRFSLPLPARLPPAIDDDGPIMVALTGQVKEQGLIAAVMPGVVQEAKGLLNIDVKGGGTWRKPDFRGGATLKDAGAYLPAAGVRLEKISGEAAFSGDGLRARVRAESGGGWLEAVGDVSMRNGELLTYKGTVEGASFRILNLPDVRAYASPHLRFNGDSRLLTARGEIDIPTMSIYSRRNQAVVRPSSDIRIVDLPKKERKGAFPLGLDVEVRVVLGDNVRMDVSGLTGRLAGALDLDIAGADKIGANGRIRIVDGTYQAYGVRLVVTRGNISFTGSADPGLDILAVKQTGQSEDVTVGVLVSGTTAKPVINLHSNRPMSDSNKLAYLVLGHPVTQGEPGQSSLFSGTAGTFEGGATPTSAAEAQARLGLAGTGGTLGGQGQATSSTIGIGRYLTPSFYVGVGRSLLTNENQVTLRYSLSRKWEIESRAGGVTGMDLFYKIEFD